MLFFDLRKLIIIIMIKSIETQIPDFFLAWINWLSHFFGSKWNRILRRAQLATFLFRFHLWTHRIGLLLNTFWRNVVFFWDFEDELVTECSNTFLFFLTLSYFSDDNMTKKAQILLVFVTSAKDILQMLKLRVDLLL